MNSEGQALTPGQQRVLETVASYRQEHGYAPTLKEIATQLGFESANAARDHLRELRRKGYVEWDDGKARTLRILPVAA